MQLKHTLLATALVAASATAMALPNVEVLATGGTIAGAGQSATGTAYTAGKVSVNHLVAAVPALAEVANVIPKQVVQIGSQDMTDDVWLKLVKTINEDCNKVDGFVVTHGTDTMEETAYFLHLILKTDKPVVFTGAMRPATALSADGILNLYNAFQVALDDQSKGLGVLMVLNNTIGSARFSTKTNTTNVATFSGLNTGELGSVIDNAVMYFNHSTRPHTMATPFSVHVCVADESVRRAGIYGAHLRVKTGFERFEKRVAHEDALPAQKRHRGSRCLARGHSAREGESVNVRMVRAAEVRLVDVPENRRRAFGNERRSPVGGVSHVGGAERIYVQRARPARERKSLLCEISARAESVPPEVKRRRVHSVRAAEEPGLRIFRYVESRGGKDFSGGVEPPVARLFALGLVYVNSPRDSPFLGLNRALHEPLRVRARRSVEPRHGNNARYRRRHAPRIVVEERVFQKSRELF